jgi:membrane protease YdiL (CAAX protease family)
MSKRRHIALLSFGFSLAIMLVAVLRVAEVGQTDIGLPSGLATPLYVVCTVVFIVMLARAGERMGGFGFRVPIKVLRAIGLGALGIVLLQVSAQTLHPLIEQALGTSRDLSRFADVAGNPDELMRLLVFSWIFAAFGEEIAFRIALMRGLSISLGDDRNARVIALFVQAVIFGLVHLYQGPAGVVGTMISGLVFGAVTLLGRGSIWPAVIAHGGNNTIGILAIYHGFLR